MRKLLIGSVLTLAFVMISLTLVGKPLPKPPAMTTTAATTPQQQPPEESLLLAAAVTVARVAPADFVEIVLATGSLVAREEILVGPEVEGLDLLGLHVARRQHQDRHVRPLAHAGDHLLAVHVRQAEVQQHHVERIARQHRQGLAAAAGQRGRQIVAARGNAVVLERPTGNVAGSMP